MASDHKPGRPAGLFHQWGGLATVFVLLLLTSICSTVVAGSNPEESLAFRYLGSLSLLLATVLVSLAIGLTALKVNRPTILALTLSFLAGYGAWGMLVFITGLAHALYAYVVTAELLFLGIVFRRRLNELPQIVCRLFDSLSAVPLAVRLLVGVIGVYLLFLLMVSLGPVSSWDALESHWPIARYFARHHAVPFPFFNGNGGTPQLLRMHFTVYCLMGFSHQASHAVWVMAPALCGLGFGFVRRLSSSGTALVLTMFAYCYLVLPPQFTLQPTLDLPPVVFGLGALIAALAPALYGQNRKADGHPPPFPLTRFFVLSGVLAGYALAIKWHVMALFPVIMLSFFLLWWAKFPLAARVKYLGWWLAGAFVPGGVYAVYNLICTGNPFWHPMIPVIWNPDYWRPVATNLRLIRENVEMYRTTLNPTPLHDLTKSLKMMIKNYAVILPALYFVPFALRGSRGSTGRIVWILLAGGILCYLIPTFLLYPHFRHTILGVAILVLLVPLGWDAVRRWKFRWLVLGLPLLVIIGLASKFSVARHPQALDLYGAAVSSVFRGPYFDDKYQFEFELPAARWAEKHLPNDAFVITDQRCLGNLDRDWMTIFPATQFVVELTPEMSADSLFRALSRLGATHLWEDQTRYWHLPEHFPSLEACMAPWLQLLTREDRLEPVYSDRRTRIYRLRQD